MDNMTAPGWEKFFAEQELALRQKNKKQKRIVTAAALAFAAVAGLLLAFFALRGVVYAQSEYAKVLKEGKKNDYTTVEQNILSYLNDKYGAGTVTADQIHVREETLPIITSGNTNYKYYMGYQLADREKIAFAIYLQDEKAVYFDNYQWPQIKAALEADLQERSGFTAVFANAAVQSERSYTRLYIKNPWLLCSTAFQTRYEGDLGAFFEKEYALRQELPGAQQAAEELRLCGTIALILADDRVPDLRARMENPALSYEAVYEKTMREMQEDYHLDILSCVLPTDYYQELAAYYASPEQSGSEMCYLEDGEGTNFFYSGYTLLSWAYDKMTRPVAEEAAKGLYLVSNDGTSKVPGYTYGNVNTPQAAAQLAETQCQGWTVQESFCVLYNGIDGSKTSLILDLEQRYPGKEVQLIITDSDKTPELCETAEDMKMNMLFQKTSVFQRDGYLFVPPIFNWESVNTFTVLVR